MKRSLPRKGRPYAILAALAAAIAVTALAAPGCGLQGEGQRCDRNVSATPNDLLTGNDDCDTAAKLVCVSKDLLGGSSDICCPSSGASTNPNCLKGGGSGTSTSATSTGSSTSSVTSTSTATSTSTGTGTSTGAGGAGTGTGTGAGTGTGTGTGGAGGAP